MPVTAFLEALNPITRWLLIEMAATALSGSRSGHRNDVTVLGQVASGAEIVAGGSIHIYGALRGRALAGSMGNARARIFCRKNEAELLAIDGYYRTTEDIDASLRNRPIQAWLEGDVLKVAAAE